MPLEILDETLEKALHEARYATKKEKAMQWKEIKERSPETASFILAVREKTGKPKRLRVKFKDKIIEVNN